MADDPSSIPPAESGSSGASEPAPSDPDREPAISALIRALEAFLKAHRDTGQSDRTILLFTRNEEEKTSSFGHPRKLSGSRRAESSLQRLLRCLQWSVLVSEMRTGVVVVGLMVLLLGLLFTPRSAFSGLIGITKEPDSLASKLSSLRRNDIPRRDQCCPLGTVPDGKGECCSADLKLSPDSPLKQTLDDTALSYAQAEKFRAEIERLNQQRALEKAERQSIREETETKSEPSKKAFGEQFGNALGNVPWWCWVVSLLFFLFLLAVTVCGTNCDGRILPYLTEMAEVAAQAVGQPSMIVDLIALRRMARNGSLVTLIREFIHRWYPPQGFNRKHLRAVANAIYDAFEGDITSVFEPISWADALNNSIPGETYWEGLGKGVVYPLQLDKSVLDWLREIASQVFLTELAKEPGFRSFLNYEAGRRDIWMPIFHSVSRLLRRSSGKQAESGSGKDAALLILVLLALSLLPVAGSYFGAAYSNRPVAEVQQRQEDRLHQIELELHIEPNGSENNASREGRDGRDGKDGRDGRNGRDGNNGRDGRDGKPGESQPGQGGDSNPGSQTGTNNTNRPSAVANVIIPDSFGDQPRNRETATLAGEVLVPLTPKNLAQSVTPVPGLTDKNKSGQATGEECRATQDTWNPALQPSETTFRISYKGSGAPVEYAAMLKDQGNKWPPDPVIMFVRSKCGKTVEVPVPLHKAYNDFLNADVWLEERLKRRNYWVARFGKNLIVVHILPRDIQNNANQSPATH